ncbi:sensor histidine kinase [Corallococcus sp. AB004]|uniref:sensor histidine kinase n=1 Tax=Corallococcus exiguus TaxID=83462 RepID=UPI000EA3FD84|nr:HAMP domain-containing sensor histidine kinase [Corallococcus exiguus]NPC69474.1 HAMP domain-containing histidine kinase [Corallococcus exiguus]NPD27094.1 HAMP domain-containing histidine kinase [Corallococcus exiguus]RKI45650.1 sensor histidine kinase [Corallococcus sp. AB004]
MRKGLPRLRAPRRMFWRVYGYGVVMMLGALLAFWGASHFIDGAKRRYDDMQQAVDRMMEVTPREPEALALELGKLASAASLNATVYWMDGTLIATTVHPPIAPLDAAEHQTFRRQLGWVERPNTVAAPVWRGRSLIGYALLQSPHPLPTFHSFLGASLGSVLLAMAGLALPLAWALAAPLERLTAAVRDFGQGRLSARARLPGRDEVAELGRAFDEMAERMELLIRSEKTLLANVSHELRTPLARLGVTLDLAEEGQPEELVRRLPDLRRDIGELGQLVEGVLQMARFDLAANDAGQPGPRLRRVPVVAATLLGETADRFSQAHPECSLALEVAPALPAVAVDAALLRRALLNLLDNARKYSEPGDPVVLRCREDSGGALRIEVEDRGIGVAPEDLLHLSRPFFRTDRSRARGTGGVGLGLTLSRRIVEAHGGTLSIASAPGEGTCVTLRLPPGP